MARMLGMGTSLAGRRLRAASVAQSALALLAVLVLALLPGSSSSLAGPEERRLPPELVWQLDPGATGTSSALSRDGRHLAAVVGFFTVGRAAITEEILLLAIGVQRQTLYPGHPYLRRFPDQVESGKRPGW